MRIAEIKNLPPKVNGTKVLQRVNSIEIRGIDFGFGERRRASISTALIISHDERLTNSADKVLTLA